MPSWMNPVDWIAKKRDGKSLTPAEIQSLVEAYTDGTMPDYQMSAWLMAGLLRGLDQAETVALTEAMLRSGQVLDFGSLPKPKVDKHSTGGVGDKISICLAPWVAACGAVVPMIAGRGLGHTGGTLDKLEAISGYRTDLSVREIGRVLRKTGAVIVGQTPELAPADRKMYALRDVTATVECIPFIVASILSKKLAEGLDALVLDVKCGSGAFMKTLPDAERLARSLVQVGRAAGTSVVALITAMDAPLGRSIGNALETREAIEVLKGQGPEDTTLLTRRLAEEMLVASGTLPSRVAARRRLDATLSDGSALERLRSMITAQGGDARVVDELDRLPRAAHRAKVKAPKHGFVRSCDAMKLGRLALRLGAGRTRADQAVDPAVGVELAVRVGERVRAGQALGWLHTNTRSGSAAAVAEAIAAFELGARAPKLTPLVIKRIAR